MRTETAKARYKANARLLRIHAPIAHFRVGTLHSAASASPSGLSHTAASILKRYGYLVTTSRTVRPFLSPDDVMSDIER